MDAHFGRSDDGEALLKQPLDLDDGKVAQRTGSGTGNDNSLGSVVDSLLDEPPVKALVAEVHK